MSNIGTSTSIGLYLTMPRRVKRTVTNLILTTTLLWLEGDHKLAKLCVLLDYLIEDVQLYDVGTVLYMFTL